MATIADIINVYKESGKEECIDFVYETCKVDSTETLPREHLRRSSLSIIAKYKNLTKHECNDSAKVELKKFLDSDFKSLISLKRDQSKSGGYFFTPPQAGYNARLSFNKKFSLLT